MTDGNHEADQIRSRHVLPLYARIDELEAEAKALRASLEDMVWEFAYRGTRDGQLSLGTGGLSGLEDAFGVLGWDDPHLVPADEYACEVEGCAEWPVAGWRWQGLYLHLCHDHVAASVGSPLPAIRPHALEREKRRGPDGILQEEADAD